MYNALVTLLLELTVYKWWHFPVENAMEFSFKCLLENSCPILWCSLFCSCNCLGRLHWMVSCLKLAEDNTIRYYTIRYDTIRYNTIQHDTIQYNTITLFSTRRLTIQCKNNSITLQRWGTHLAVITWGLFRIDYKMFVFGQMKKESSSKQ